jgi:hypothetical protein
MKIKEPHKLPPMAATIRGIMPKMQYPPPRKETKDSKGRRKQDGITGDNLAYSAIIQAMLHHAKGIRPDATQITVSPAVQQIADVCQVSKRTIRRYMAELKEHGTITSCNKGSQISSDFTIHVGHLGVTLGDGSDSPDKPSSDRTQKPSDRTQEALDLSLGDHLRSKPSGANPQEKAKASSSVLSKVSTNERSPKSKDATGSNPARSYNGLKLRPLAEMADDPDVIAWRAAGKSLEAWRTKLKQLATDDEISDEDYDAAIDEANDNIKHWTTQYTELEKVVEAKRLVKGESR